MCSFESMHGLKMQVEGQRCWAPCGDAFNQAGSLFALIALVELTGG